MILQILGDSILLFKILFRIYMDIVPRNNNNTTTKMHEIVKIIIMMRFISSIWEANEVEEKVNKERNQMKANVAYIANNFWSKCSHAINHLTIFHDRCFTSNQLLILNNLCFMLNFDYSNLLSNPDYMIFTLNLFHHRSLQSLNEEE